MKVISLLQPWASLVVLGHKKIETRSWNTKHRGPVLIHASKAWKPEQEKLLEQYHFSTTLQNEQSRIILPFGKILGVVDIVDVAPTSHYLSLFGDRTKTGLSAQLDAEKEQTFGDYSPGRYGWLLANARAFKEPIPAKGQLGLWDYDIDLNQIEYL